MFVCLKKCNFMKWFAKYRTIHHSVHQCNCDFPRQQGTWHHFFTSAHLPQFALASSVSGYSQKVADLLESMAELPGVGLQGRDIGDINVVPLPNLRSFQSTLRRFVPWMLWISSQIKVKTDPDHRSCSGICG